MPDLVKLGRVPKMKANWDRDEMQREKKALRTRNTPNTANTENTATKPSTVVRPSVVTKPSAEKLRQNWDRDEVQRDKQAAKARQTLGQNWERKEAQQEKKVVKKQQPTASAPKTQPKKPQQEKPKASDSGNVKKFDASKAFDASASRTADYAVDEYGNNGKFRSRQSVAVKAAKSSGSSTKQPTADELRNASGPDSRELPYVRDEYGSNGKRRNRTRGVLAARKGRESSDSRRRLMNALKTKDRI